MASVYLNTAQTSLGHMIAYTGNMLAPAVPPDWKQRIRPFAQARYGPAVRQMLSSFGLWIGAWMLAWHSLSVHYALTLLCCIAGAIGIMRIFSIQHDCGHGSFLPQRWQRDLLGFICGIVTITPYQCWRKIHATHHREAGNLGVGRSVGDFPLLTVDEYLARSPFQRWQYRLLRHPLFVLGIVPFMLFFVIQRLPILPGMPLTQVAKFSVAERYSVHATNLALIVLWSLMGSLLGWQAFLSIQIPMLMLASTAGVFLFFVQHQFEHTYWAEEGQVDPWQVAMQGSSYLKLPRWLQWSIGHTGYHHLHHLSVRIPNYQLPACHAADPLWQQAPTLDLKAAWGSFAYTLWDPHQRKLVRFQDVG
jgi:omega-6 fatty acid desaturase (delta-12 desaturase)